MVILFLKINIIFFYHRWRTSARTARMPVRDGHFGFWRGWRKINEVFHIIDSSRLEIDNTDGYRYLQTSIRNIDIFPRLPNRPYRNIPLLPYGTMPKARGVVTEL